VVGSGIRYSQRRQYPSSPYLSVIVPWNAEPSDEEVRAMVAEELRRRGRGPIDADGPTDLQVFEVLDAEIRRREALRQERAG
jgi:hypothetical protein